MILCVIGPVNRSRPSFEFNLDYSSKLYPMNYWKSILGVFIITLSLNGAESLYSQDPNATRLTLEDVVELAQSDAPDALLAETEVIL